MNNKILEEILASECKGQSGFEESKNSIKNNDIDAYNYNQLIVGVLNENDESNIEYKSLQTDDLIDPSLNMELKNLDAQIYTENISDEISKNLEFFYDIEYSPSYLYYGKKLLIEDFDFFTDIYADIYEIEKEKDSKFSIGIKEIMDNYIESVLKVCKENTTITEIKRLVEK